jgi:hypothetical protein
MSNPVKLFKETKLTIGGRFAKTGYMTGQEILLSGGLK